MNKLNKLNNPFYFNEIKWYFQYWCKKPYQTKWQQNISHHNFLKWQQNPPNKSLSQTPSYSGNRAPPRIPPPPPHCRRPFSPAAAVLRRIPTAAHRRPVLNPAASVLNCAAPASKGLCCSRLLSRSFSRWVSAFFFGCCVDRKYMFCSLIELNWCDCCCYWPWYCRCTYLFMCVSFLIDREWFGVWFRFLVYECEEISW